MSGVIQQLLTARGLNDANARKAFCNPDYIANKYNPFLLPDMANAVQRIVQSHQNNEFVYIYGDYDIDGLTATSILLDAFTSFGIRSEAYIPNRFTDGYGLNKDAIRQIAQRGAQLIVTVDCGSLSHTEVTLANELGIDVVITDHHTVGETMPPAIATVNPKRLDHDYPFKDLAGCGVAFKLVQALQTKLDGLPDGHEKWLLDLVAFGTVCDVVSLVDENRTNVYWGLQVMQKTRRPGLKAILQVAGVAQNNISARSLGFAIGPHLNAAGRLKTAQHSLDLLTESDPMKALEIAYLLHEMNIERRATQDKIFKAACQQAEQFIADPVLVLSNAEWSHGIIGIVAAKILEKYQKPAFVIEELGSEAKGSARSYGDFSAVEAINAAKKWVIKGGGHKLAAGVTLKTEHIPHFRMAVNDYYHSLKLQNQLRYFDATADAFVQDLSELNDELMAFLKTLEPFGHGNAEPVFCAQRVIVEDRRQLGKDGSHLKLRVVDAKGNRWGLIGFGKAQRYAYDVGDTIDVWFNIIENEWRGSVTLEGQLLYAGEPQE